jgi:hypothetical protein
MHFRPSLAEISDDPVDEQYSGLIGALALDGFLQGR